MPEHADVSENIGGTVIQRSFVASGIPRVIHIASVSASDISATDLSLKEIVAETLSVPYSSALTAEEYADVVNSLSRRFSLPENQTPLYESGGLPSFAEDFLTLLTSHYYDFVDNRYPVIGLSRDLVFRQEVGLPSETIQTALACLGARTNKTPEVDAFIKELHHYEIPIGQSPEVKGDSLLRIIETSKSACLAPLLVGGASGINQLSHGDYVGALLSAGTASLMTVIFIGTVSVGSLLVNKVAQVRRLERASPTVSRGKK